MPCIASSFRSAHKPCGSCNAIKSREWLNLIFPSDNMDALFLRWRETIEKAISDKFDAGGAPDVASVHLFLKDVNRR
jgi:uncharacterized protein (DUF2235 family)